MKQQLTILGDRQSGKSYVLNLLAVDAALRGEFVLYECDSLAVAGVRFREIVDLAQERSGFLKAWYSNGRQRVDFLSGGLIRFISTSRPGARVRTPDLHLLDNVTGEGHFMCERVVRTVLR